MNPSVVAMFVTAYVTDRMPAFIASPTTPCQRAGARPTRHRLRRATLSGHLGDDPEFRVER
jgi:hypothetical protein